MSELLCTRANRKKNGLVELRFWLTPEQRERVLKYIDYLKEIDGGCFCDKSAIGVRGKSCGDCPRDYAAKQFL